MNHHGARFLSIIDDLAVSLLEKRGGATSQDSAHRWKNQACLSDEHTRLLVTPVYALIKVTNRCNSGCIYCNHSIHGEAQLSLHDPSTEGVQKAISEVAELGVRSVNLSGGEPTLRPDLPELIDYAHGLGLVTILLTNGLTLAESWNELGRSGLNYIILSLDSLDAEMYRRQRGASYEQAWQGVEAALRLRDKYPPAFVDVTTVVTKHNLAELPDLVRKLASYGISVQFSPYHHFDTQVTDHNTPEESAAVHETIEELISLLDSGYPIVNSRAYLKHMPSFFSKPHVLPWWYRCYAGHVAVFVDAELSVRPCWSWSLPVLGNLKRDELRTIWYSPSFRRAREKMLELECSRCWLLCTAELSIRFMEQG